MTLVLVCWLQVLAWAPALHEGVCGELFNSPQHHCAVTLFSKAQVTPAAPPEMVLLPPAAFLGDPVVKVAVRTLGDLRAAPSRDPPIPLA